MTLPGSYSQYYILFQSLHQTILTFSKTYWQTKLQNFPDFISLLNDTNIFRELLINNTTYFSKVHIKQYWHFWRVHFKLNYSKNIFQSSYHTILTLSECYFQTVSTYSELISKSIYSFTELLPNNNKHFFLRVSIVTWTNKKFSNRKFLSKSEKVSIHTWNR